MKRSANNISQAFHDQYRKHVLNIMIIHKKTPIFVFVLL